MKRETEPERQKERESERERERDIDRQRQRQKQKDSEKQAPGRTPPLQPGGGESRSGEHDQWRERDPHYHLVKFEGCPRILGDTLVPEAFQIRTSFVVHLRFSWYKFKTEDFYNCSTGPCFQICTTKISDGPEKTFQFGKVLP